ncbi:MAG TPA: DMT family protein, partial [Thauera aminoaromatica]|nr:DMT family protein [Thauera aminoaromatica]
MAAWIQSVSSIPVWMQTALLLTASNVFMTFAWYGHLKNMQTKAWYVAA